MWKVKLFLRGHLYTGALEFQAARDAVLEANQALVQGVVDSAVVAHSRYHNIVDEFRSPRTPEQERDAALELEEKVAALDAVA
jgi:hypothetical protein